MPGSSGGGGGNTTTTTSNIPEYLQAPTERLIARGEALTGPDAQYQQYTGERVAGFSPMQEAAFQGVANMQTPGQFAQGQQSLSNAQDIANMGALGAASYQPGAFQAATYNAAMQGATGYDPMYASAVGYAPISAGSQGYSASLMNTNDPRLQYEAAQAKAAGPISIRDLGQGDVERYMSPYQQNVTDIAKQKAALEGEQMMNRLGAKAALGGAFGGSRFGLEQAQGLRDIGANLSNIQMQGSQNAYDRALAQFNADQARQLQGGMFNAGNVQQANLANMLAQNQARQFGAGNIMTGELANQGATNRASEFGAAAANAAALANAGWGNQAGMFGAQAANQAALANAGWGNQAGMFGAQAANQAAAANAAAQNAASQFGGQNFMTAQQLAEQSRQFGGSLGLQGADLAARTGLSAAQLYGQQGLQQQQAELERLNALNAAGAQQQAQAQRLADVGYENFQNAANFDRNNLSFLSGLLRGQPYGTTQTTVAPTPSTASQLAGLGLGGIGAYKLFGG